jgi:F-type H+-transporting ATPase subunit b
MRTPREGWMGSHAQRTARRPHLAVVTSLLLAAVPALAEEGHGSAHTLVLFPEWAELIPLIVLFLLLIPLVNTLLFKPIFRVLDARQERIDGSRRRAARLEQDANGVLQRYRTAVSEVRAEADAARKLTIEEARRAQAEQVARERAEAERQRERTKLEIDSALEAARKSLRLDIDALAQQAAARILGRSLS